jgi:hypothetical protein
MISATWVTAYQRGVKIISLAEFAITINTLALCAWRHRLDSPATVQSEAKMIKTARRQQANGVKGVLVGGDD